MMPQFADIFTTSTYEEYAAFANATVHIGPRFHVTFGGRYSSNHQFDDQGGTGPLAPPPLESTSSDNVFPWLGSARYQVSDTVRSDERRVGKECVSPYRSIWAPAH